MGRSLNPQLLPDADGNLVIGSRSHPISLINHQNYTNSTDQVTMNPHNVQQQAWELGIQSSDINQAPVMVAEDAGISSVVVDRPDTPKPLLEDDGLIERNWDRTALNRLDPIIHLKSHALGFNVPKSAKDAAKKLKKAAKKAGDWISDAWDSATDWLKDWLPDTNTLLLEAILFAAVLGMITYLVWKFSW